MRQPSVLPHFCGDTGTFKGICVPACRMPDSGGWQEYIKCNFLIKRGQIPVFVRKNTGGCRGGLIKILIFVYTKKWYSLDTDRWKRPEIKQEKCFISCFFLWLVQKKGASLWRYPENNLFTLKKTNTYWKLGKKALCEKRLFFVFLIFIFHSE